MMDNKEILKTAFEIYFNEKYPYNPNSEEIISWEFTEQYHFEDKMNRLIAKRKLSYWKYVNTIGKRVAIILIVIIVTFSTAMTVNAFREPIVEFVVKTYEKFSSLFVEKNMLIETDEILYERIYKQMSPKIIPDSFTEYANYNDDYLCIIKWENKDGENISFYQYTYSTAMTIDTENVNLHKTVYNDLSIYYFTQDNEPSYFWYKDGYAFSLITPSYFSLEQAEKIIESIK